DPPYTAFFTRSLHDALPIYSAQESLVAIDKAQQAGFGKLSIDLMYGFPQEDHELWIRDLSTAIQLDPGHISSYALTVEPETALRSEEHTSELQSRENLVCRL